MTESKRFESLTLQHRACLRLWDGRGSGPRIAQKLQLTKSTVESHLASARRILGVSSTDEAANLFQAYERGDYQDPPTYPVQVDRDLQPPQLDPLPDSPTQPRLPLPVRAQGATENDLSIRQRLVWIVLVALGIALGVGAVANAVRVINDIVRR